MGIFSLPEGSDWRHHPPEGNNPYFVPGGDLSEPTGAVLA